MSAPTHELKVWPAYFDDLLDGRKTFELRFDDRDFTEGDWLILREYEPHRGEYTGRGATTWITYVLRDAEEFGLRPGYVVLSLGTVTPC